MGQIEQRPLHSPEEMLALAEELAAKHPARKPEKQAQELPRWAKNLLWFAGGAAAAWLASGAMMG